MEGSQSTDVSFGVPQGSVLDPLFFLLYISSLLSGLSCRNLAYADDTTIYVILTKAADRITSAERLINDLIFIKAWCIQRRVELNSSKTKSILFSRSRTVYPEHPVLSLDDTRIDDVEKLRLLGVTFDSKVSFECHVRSITQAVSPKLGIMRKC